MGPTLTFHETAKRDVLGYLDKDVDIDGNIVEHADKTQKVLSFDDGSEVTVEEFGGIRKGSEVIIRNDIVSLLRFSKRQ